MKELTKQNKELFGCLPKAAIAEFLPDLYLWEADDYGDWTISELIELVNQKLKELK